MFLGPENNHLIYLIAAFQYLKGVTRRLERDFSHQHVVTGQWRRA